MSDRFVDLADGQLVDSDPGHGYRVVTVSSDEGRSAEAKGLFVGTFDEAEVGTRGIEQCSCEAGMGGCRQSIWLTCWDTEVQFCIEQLVANCDR